MMALDRSRWAGNESTAKVGSASGESFGRWIAFSRFLNMCPKTGLPHEIVDRAVKGFIRLSIGLPLIDNRQQGVAPLRYAFALLGVCQARGTGDYLSLEHAPDIQKPQQGLALKPHHGWYQVGGPLHRGSEIGAVASAPANGAQSFPSVQSLANG